MSAETESGPRRPRLLAALGGLLVLGVTVAAVEASFRLVDFDFDFQRRAFEKLPIFYRQPVVRTGAAFLRRPGPDRWHGRPLITRMRQKGIPEQYLPLEEEVTISYDAEGFRNPADLGDWEIAVAGDSFTELGYLPWEQLFTTRLGELLGVAVKNLGVSFTGTFSHVHYLRKYGAAPSARHAVLAFFEGNDLTDLTLEALRVQHARKQAEAGEPLASDGSLLDEIESQSSFVRALYRRVRGGPKPEEAAPLALPNAWLLRGESQTAVSVYFAPPSSDEVPPKQLELLERALEAWRRTARRLGMKPWLLYLPAKLRVLHGHLEFWENARPRVVAWQPSDLPDVVRDAAVRHAIAFVDPTPALREDAAAGGMPYNPVWDTHFSAQGCETLGRVLADAMREAVAAGARSR